MDYYQLRVGFTLQVDETVTKPTELVVVVFCKRLGVVQQPFLMWSELLVYEYLVLFDADCEGPFVSIELFAGVKK